jgi:GntR family transcriptional regulator
MADEVRVRQTLRTLTAIPTGKMPSAKNDLSPCDRGQPGARQLSTGHQNVLILWYIRTVDEGSLIQFRLDRRSGVPVYRQIVDQVRQALRLGVLRPGDQLPTVREVVEQIAINPNTVHRAYLELEAQELIEGQPGRGTFVRRSLPGLSEGHEELERSLVDWFRTARALGLADEAIDALLASAKRATHEEAPT